MCHSGFRTPAGEHNVARVLPWMIVLVSLVLFSPAAHAQWITQTNSLRPGWNAVFLHVDASHATLDQLVGNDLANPIQEIWYWHPSLPGGQFIESPELPTGNGSQWSTWTRVLGANSVLQRLSGNGAYLVKVATNSPASYDWRVKGKPVTPT